MRVAVLVPVHDQAAFLGRALGSLLAQTHANWDAVVLDDGSTDDVAGALAPWRTEARVQVRSWPDNRGLGATLNAGLAATDAPLVAYLPADDTWDAGHLAALVTCLADGGLAWSGVRHHGDRSSLGAPPGFPLQLVQVAHARSGERWTERSELESDDLGLLLWDRLAHRIGPGVGTGRVTCTWTDHPGQRHKAMRERYDGGLNVFRSRYRVATPLRFHSSDRGLVDEVARYASYRSRRTEPAPDGLRILIAGELAFNPERVVALAERGHTLLGLWTREGLGDSTVGPVPFGHVTDLPDLAGIAGARPDVVWAQLNWRAVPLALAVRRAHPGLPFVWHFKESPQRCLARGDWPLLAELFVTANRSLVATEEERAWLLDALPDRLDPARIGVLDGDLPPADRLEGAASPRLSAGDGEPHTVLLGRPVGFDAAWVRSLTDRGIHLHLHGQVDAPGPTGGWRDWWAEAVAGAGGRLHLHPAVEPADWVRVLSAYDAGWLHRVGSANHGDVRRATWDDLNTPARLPTLLAAGLPLLLPDTTGHRVAVSRLAEEQGWGLTYAGADDVAARLGDPVLLADRRRAALAARHHHTFDAHADRLVDVLRAAVER